ncbi:nucleotidyltransferase family protein [Aliikangiella coralliicola]|uniref:Nucleotidyltransferase family protein n=1 Tax=Aliikangiella coralliicola TaxID=2592383 RepID=A0A545UJ88_9GAMM|nr:nucleotidyltransferase family protein [Aliikangiella coralliicola]TQV89503.1 nucleotidyltransferase family protein [Aliikangiella coralliicola]
MRHTIKEISETLFGWLATLLRGDSSYFPEEIKNWSDKEWEVAKTIVFVHGMGPLWGKECSRGLGCQEIPDEFRDYLIQQYHQNGLRIQKIRECYERITQGLSRKKTRFVPFKGIELAFNVYPDPATRPMADIDLYLDSKDKDLIDDILTEGGFTPVAITESGATYYPGEWIDKQKNMFRLNPTNMDINNELYAGENENSPFGIDVHFEIKILALRDLTCAFESARLESGKLADTEHFIYLLVHAAKHFMNRGGRWLHLYDIYLFEKKHKLDYQLIVKKAVEWRVAHLLLISLSLCEHYFSSFHQLKALLYAEVGWRHKLLVNNLQLSEMSCCNPWPVSPFAQFIWVHSFVDGFALLAAFKNRKKNTQVREGKSLSSIPWAGARLLTIINRLIQKKPREVWSIMAAHDLSPKQDWK